MPQMFALSRIESLLGTLIKEDQKLPDPSSPDGPSNLTHHPCFYHSSHTTRDHLDVLARKLGSEVRISVFFHPNKRTFFLRSEITQLILK